MEKDSSSGVHLWLVLMKAYHALLKRAVESIEASGLGYSDFSVLEVLMHKGPTPVNTIGEKVRLTTGSISVAVDRLEAKGLVERRANAEDRRTRVVHLTAVGRRTIAVIFAAHSEAMERATAGLSAEERAEAVRLLRKLGLGAESLS